MSISREVEEATHVATTNHQLSLPALFAKQSLGDWGTEIASQKALAKTAEAAGEFLRCVAAVTDNEMRMLYNSDQKVREMGTAAVTEGSGKEGDKWTRSRHALSDGS